MECGRNGAELRRSRRDHLAVDIEPPSFPAGRIGHAGPPARRHGFIGADGLKPLLPLPDSWSKKWMLTPIPSGTMRFRSNSSLPRKSAAASIQPAAMQARNIGNFILISPDIDY